MEEKFQTELRCRRRNRGESLRELAQDIRNLMAMAYPGEKSGLSEHIARDSFLTALGDAELELKVREREPKNLGEAVGIAQRIELFRNTVELSAAGRQRVKCQVVDSRSGDVLPMDLETRLVKLKRRYLHQMMKWLQKHFRFRKKMSRFKDEVQIRIRGVMEILCLFGMTVIFGRRT